MPVIIRDYADTLMLITNWPLPDALKTELNSANFQYFVLLTINDITCQNHSTVKPWFTVPRFTGSPDLPGPNSFPRKQALCVNCNRDCTPIYRAPRFTGPNSSPPRGPVNQGFTVIKANADQRVLSSYTWQLVRSSWCLRKSESHRKIIINSAVNVCSQY